MLVGWLDIEGKHHQPVKLAGQSVGWSVDAKPQCHTPASGYYIA